MELAKRIGSTFDPLVDHAEIEAWRYKPRPIRVSRAGCFDIDGLYTPVLYSRLAMDGRAIIDQPDVHDTTAKLLYLKLIKHTTSPEDARGWIEVAPLPTKVYQHNGCPIWQRVGSDRITQITSTFGVNLSKVIAVRSPCLYYGGHKQWHIGIGASDRNKALQGAPKPSKSRFRLTCGEVYYTTKTAFHTWHKINKRDPVLLKFTPENVQGGQTYAIHRHHKVRMGNKLKLEYVEPENAIEKFLRETLGAESSVSAEERAYLKELDQSPELRLSKHWSRALVKQDSKRSDDSTADHASLKPIHARFKCETGQPTVLHLKSQPSIKSMIKRLKREKLLNDPLSEQQQAALVNQLHPDSVAAAGLPPIDAQKLAIGAAAASVGRARESTLTNPELAAQHRPERTPETTASQEPETHRELTVATVDPLDRPTNPWRSLPTAPAEEKTDQAGSES